MAGHSISPSGKTGSPGKHYVRWTCEMGTENKRLFKGETHGRESLRCVGRVTIVAPPTDQANAAKCYEGGRIFSRAHDPSAAKRSRISSSTSAGSSTVAAISSRSRSP